jgi:hypothetical protein
VLGMMWRHSFARHEERPFDAAALCRAHLQLLSRGLAAPGSGRPGKENPRKENRTAGNRPRLKRNGVAR